MINIKASAIVSIAALAFAASAHADIQTWRLTSTSYRVQDGFTAPAFAQTGNTFSIDYVIDTSAAPLFASDSLFNRPVLSFTINGITSEASGYISAGGGLNAINIWPTSGRNDGIDFISFNNFAGTPQTDIASALKEFSTYAKTRSTDLRVDFGDKSVWAQPSSFVMTSSVPEPTTWFLMLLGAPLVLLRARGQRAA